MEIVIEYEITIEEHDGYCSDPEKLDDIKTTKIYHCKFDEIFDKNGNFIPMQILRFNYQKPTPNCSNQCGYSKKSRILRIYNANTNANIPYKLDYFSYEKCRELDEQVHNFHIKHNYSLVPDQDNDPIFYLWFTGKRFWNEQEDE